VSHGRGTDDGLSFWGELTDAQKRDALARGVDWEGFTAGEKADVIGRVLDGEPAAAWMDVIKYYNPEEDFPRPLTRKQHAAYLADFAASYGMTAEEVDESYERLENEGIPEAAAADAQERRGSTPYVEGQAMTRREQIERAAGELRRNGDGILFWEPYTEALRREALAYGLDWEGFTAGGEAAADAPERPAAAFDASIDAEWREVKKLELIVEDAWWASGRFGKTIPGVAVLGAVERHVDYAGLPAAQREMLQDLRAGLDAGRLGETRPDGKDDVAIGLERVVGVGRSLRVAELEARVGDFQRSGVTDDRGRRRAWQQIGEGEKFDRIWPEIEDLRLTTEPKAYEVIGIEVDIRGLPEEQRRTFEGDRAAAWGEPADVDKINREALLRITHRLHREIGYAGFRLEYFNDPDAINEWPDPAVRERELRSSWSERAEQAYPSYREKFTDASTEYLAGLRTHLRSMLGGSPIDQVDFYNRASARGRDERVATIPHEASADDRHDGEALPSPGEIAEERDDPATASGPERGQYQVWHDTAWPENSIHDIAAGAIASAFPDDFRHVATVRADGLREAFQRTAVLEGPRATLAGDVIVDPRGQPWRIAEDRFEAIKEGTYRVWQANDPSAAQAGWGAFPQDYRPAIDVSTDSRERAYALVDGGAWWEDRYVDVIADHVRTTRPGDVIVDPRGKAHRITPEGFAAIDPAKERAAADEPPLERVERQLRDWKHDHSREFVPDPATGRIGPGTHRWSEDAWAVMPEADKLRVLENEIDWTGVHVLQKAIVLAREVDFRKVSSGEIARDADGPGPEGLDRERQAPAPGAIGRRDGRFQVWHANDVEAVSQSELEGGPFGHGYTLAARVEARNVVDAFYATNHGDTPWPQQPGAEALIDEPRSTAAGDVIVDPEGRVYRVEAGVGGESWLFRRIAPQDGKSPEQRSRESFERFLEAAARGQGGNRVPSPGEIAEWDSPAPASGPERGKGRHRERPARSSHPHSSRGPTSSPKSEVTMPKNPATAGACARGRIAA
jgi:hypothetical protein